LFLNPGVGMGKSTLLYACAISKARESKHNKVIVLNQNKSLLYRDYKKVEHLAKQWNISVRYFDESDKSAINDAITFMTPAAFELIGTG
jgi:Rad3-related DNA helicase